ncbi:hypothetical protein HanRHA438_Chr02g0080431 [Helianthus annuus]|nr:hypothetical protein HanRHA438_Chr02g0080431 [Helianthus annuus]
MIHKIIIITIIIIIIIVKNSSYIPQWILVFLTGISLPKSSITITILQTGIAAVIFIVSEILIVRMVFPH